MTKQLKEYSIIELDHFIQATRDSGYKGTASAIAELIDNAFEASATCVSIRLQDTGPQQMPTVIVSDNGTGMLPSVLRLALRFGGSTRFNSRKGTGRYGMGLPNSSLSRARRVDVYSWTTPRAVWWSYLDVDEIAEGRLSCVPKPKRTRLPLSRELIDSISGTVVVWSNCDRLDCKKGKTLAAKLHKTLGRVFRRQLWEGKAITINGTPVKPVDPLFRRKGNNLVGAKLYGAPLYYEIMVPGSMERRSAVTVTFAELPIEKWHRFSNEEKRCHGISKNAGVSIVRSGREVDYGWFFMGNKRKENYDDWWRCEVQFNADLDELFGVTNTKQGVHPTEEIKNILSPDIERIAHQLNSRVRRRYLRVKAGVSDSSGQRLAESRDHLLEPPAKALKPTDRFSDYGLRRLPRSNRNGKGIIRGLAYRLEHKTLEDASFFVPLISRRELVVLLNEEHPFYERIYAPLIRLSGEGGKQFRQFLELLLFAAARAECSIPDEDRQSWARSVREMWSKTLAAFLD
ncbi:MAG TPA: ATP-binding protein [Pyrinomonadaceae bacterium]|nr:ATP-binding protein [Pyrinomonadaceae bacterium]